MHICQSWSAFSSSRLQSSLRPCNDCWLQSYSCAQCYFKHFPPRCAKLAKSFFDCLESVSGKKMVGEADLRVYLDKWDKKYWATYKVLDILQKVFYRSNPAREAFVEMCESDYVQKMTFDSYLYKTVVPGNPLDDAKLLLQVQITLITRWSADRSHVKMHTNVTLRCPVLPALPMQTSRPLLKRTALLPS